MPFLRFTRDKRGYENTFVMHAARARGRKRSRVLYWFRTPPGVRVGRAALDEEAIRTIEASHPDIDFDWTAILQSRGSDGAAALPGSPRREKRRERRPPSTPPSTPPVAERHASIDVETRVEPTIESPPAVEPLAGERSGETIEEPFDRDDTSEAAEVVPMLERPSALEELVGAEGVARLRARFAELRARIAEQPDPATLRAEAEGLDPDAWVTSEEARRGLEEFEAGFEAIRRKLPPRRRRRGRGSKMPEQTRPQGSGLRPQPDSDD